MTVFMDNLTLISESKSLMKHLVIGLQKALQLSKDEK